MTGRLLLPALLAGCAASRAVAPLPKGTGAITASLGGPLFLYGGAPMPAPLAVVGYRHGVTARTGVHGALHLTPLALLGVGGADVGVNTEALPPDGARPRVMLDVTVSAFAGDNQPGDPAGGFRLFPDLGAIASWDLGPRRHHVYGGLRLFVQPFPEVNVVPVPIVGGVVRTGRVGWQAELGWPAVTTSNLPNFVEWVGPFHQGAISAQLGAAVALGRQP